MFYCCGWTVNPYFIISVSCQPVSLRFLKHVCLDESSLCADDPDSLSESSRCLDFQTLHHLWLHIAAAALLRAVPCLSPQVWQTPPRLLPLTQESCYSWKSAPGLCLSSPLMSPDSAGSTTHMSHTYVTIKQTKTHTHFPFCVRERKSFG